MPISLYSCNDPRLAFELLIEQLKPKSASLTSLFDQEPTILVPNDKMIQELPLEVAKLQGFAPSLQIQSLPAWWQSYAKQLFPLQTILQTEDYSSFFFNQERKNEPQLAPIYALERAEHKTKLLELLFLYRPEEMLRLEPKNAGATASLKLEKNLAPFSPACKDLILAYHSFKQLSQGLTWLDLYQNLKEPNFQPPANHSKKHQVLFGFSQLAPYWLELFERLAKWHEISLILFNPSSAYWLAVSNHNKLMETDFPELEGSTGLFQETPAFFALEKIIHRSCRPLKELYLTLIKKGWSEDLAFAEPPFKKPNNLLSQLQTSISSYLSLESDAQQAVKALPPQSIELGFGVFAADSMQHEIAALEIKLKEFYQLYPDTAADEVCILSPNPELYNSYLTLYGGALAKENVSVYAYDAFLPGFFWKEPKPKADFQSFLKLTDLFFSAFSSQELLEVLAYPDFIKGFAEDSSLIRLYEKLLTDIKFIKGLNADQLAWLSLPALVEGTLGFQLQSFLVNYLYGDHSNLEQASPLKEEEAPDCWVGAHSYYIQDFTVFQPLLSFVTTAESFLQEHRELIEKKEQLFPLAVWQKFFESALELFLDPKSLGPLKKELSLKWVALKAYKLEGFSRRMIERLLLTAGKKLTITPNYWLKGHSSISNLANFSWSKKKAIFCLGMDEANFQKNQEKAKEETKNLFLQTKPLDPQFEKGVDFLRALFYAEKFFWVSYVEKHKAERRFFSAAFVLQNLLDYLELTVDGESSPPAYVFNLPNFARSYPPVEPIQKSARDKASKTQSDLEQDFSWTGFVRFWQNPLKSYFDSWAIDLDADVWVTKNLKQQLFLQSDFAENTLYLRLQQEALEYDSLEQSRIKLFRNLRADYAFTALGKHKLKQGLNKYQPWFQSLSQLKPKLEQRKLQFSLPIRKEQGLQTYNLAFEQYFYDDQPCFFAQDSRGLNWQGCITSYLRYLLLLREGKTENLLFASATESVKPSRAKEGEGTDPDSTKHPPTSPKKAPKNEAPLAADSAPPSAEASSEGRGEAQKSAHLQVFQFIPPNEPQALLESLLSIYQKRFLKFNFLPTKLANGLLSILLTEAGWESFAAFQSDFDQLLKTWQKAANYGDDYYHLQRIFLDVPSDQDEVTAVIHQNTLESAFIIFSALKLKQRELSELG